MPQWFGSVHHFFILLYTTSTSTNAHHAALSLSILCVLFVDMLACMGWAGDVHVCVVLCVVCLYT